MATDQSTKTAIITGGGSGIGLETARALVGHGAKVVLNGRNALKLEKAARDIDPSRGSVVFLAGDISYGPRLLIDAVASGKQVARKVFEFVRGQKLVEEVQVVHLEIPDYAREPDYEKLKRTKVSTLRPEERATDPLAIVEIGYDPSQAMCEGCRCLDCGVNTIFDSDKCILCGGCADVCPELCLELVSLQRLDGGELLERTLAGQAGEEDGALFSAIIKDETKCIRCALCAERCPVGAITMERLNVMTSWNLQ